MEQYLQDLSRAPLSWCENAETFLQSDFWGAFKGSFAWKPHAFRAVWRDGGEKPLLALYRTLAAGRGFAYVPWGPDVPASFSASPEARTELLLETARALKSFLPGSTAFIRFDPPWFSAGDEAAPRIFKPFCRAASDIQPPDTVIIDIKPPLDLILARMKPKWRYNIKLGAKKTRVSRADTHGLDTFYALLTETARRDRIAVHGIAYYKGLFDTAASHAGVDTRLYLAEADGKPLAGIITLFRGKTAVYLYGASSSLNRNLMAAYALQWQAIRDAKDAGCTEYDLFGIPPLDSPKHPMAGLYLFKTGFGGRIIHRPGSWDYPVDFLFTKFFWAAEKFRKTLRGIHKTAKRFCRCAVTTAAQHTRGQ
ncbi:MAG: peptidoglycan bridge formation glycyltransferase FemA/FemB family protein [Spirochaetaceae bacterium]|nr:peptidoglycan bridge formation glycyltransferase FemA/FemB family protein [Spirochaetaceae bacterium]